MYNVQTDQPRHHFCKHRLAYKPKKLSIKELIYVIGIEFNTYNTKIEGIINTDTVNNK